MKNRDMFYKNVAEGYQSPGMFMPPAGYMMNSAYQSYGPNVLPQNESNTNDYENRISRLERQVKNLDSRLQKIENEHEDNTNENFYMI